MSDRRRLREPLVLLRRTLGPPNARGYRAERFDHELPVRGVLTRGSLATEGAVEDASSRTVTDWTAIVRGHHAWPAIEGDAARPVGAQDRMRDDAGHVFVIDGVPQREGARVGSRRRRTVFVLRDSEG